MRTVAIGQVLPIEHLVAQERSAISQRLIRLYHFGGNECELVTKITFHPKRNRYHVCYGVAGAISADVALDLIIENTSAFMSRFDSTMSMGCNQSA